MNITLNKLNIIISAESIDRSVDDNEVIKLLNTKYSQAYSLYKHGVCLYRGINNKNELSQVIEYRPINRVSSDGQNALNYFMSELLPSWKDYPKRSESAICSTSFNYANSFAHNDSHNIYVVFPKNNALIGVCPANDMWSSFSRITTEDYTFNLATFNSVLIRFFGVCNIIINPAFILYENNATNKKIFDNEAEKIAEYFKNFDHTNILQCINNCNTVLKNKKINEKLYRYYDYNDYLTEFITDLNKGDIIKSIDNILNTKKHKFELLKLNNVQSFPENTEAWTDSTCLLIKCNVISNYLK